MTIMFNKNTIKFDFFLKYADNEGVELVPITMGAAAPLLTSRDVNNLHYADNKVTILTIPLHLPRP